jgi:hypothetical protein
VPDVIRKKIKQNEVEKVGLFPCPELVKITTLEVIELFVLISNSHYEWISP